MAGEKCRKAIIIGGGPAGLSAALRLQQQTNISCTVYELRLQPVTIGGAVGIPSNGMQLLHRLGVHDELVSRGSSHSKVIIHSLQRGVLGERDMVDLAQKETSFGYLRVKRTDLVDVLLHAVNEAKIPVYFNKRLTSIEEHNNGVTAKFSDGTSETADILIGCDGIHSQVRGIHVDPPQKPEYSGIAGVGCIIPASNLKASTASQMQGLNATFTQEGMFLSMTCTAADDEILWAFSKEVAMPKEGDTRDGWEIHRKEEMQGFKQPLLDLLEHGVGEWTESLREMVDKTSAVNFYPIYRLPLGRPWSKGRCILLGDAAHAMQPHAGQGVSMALEDVFLLSRLLEDPSRSISDSFEVYNRIRRPRVDEIAKFAAQNAGQRKRTGPWKLWLKELVMSWYMQVSGVLNLDRNAPGHLYQIYDIDKEAL